MFLLSPFLPAIQPDLELAEGLKPSQCPAPEPWAALMAMQCFVIVTRLLVVPTNRIVQTPVDEAVRDVNLVKDETLASRLS